MKKYIIIVAGGTGSRMKSDVPKQFILLQGKPILMRTIERFTHSFPDIQIIVVLNAQYRDEWKSLCEKHQFNIEHTITEGGQTRFHSVKNGLTLVPDNCVVGIHDAARPLVSYNTIITAFNTAEETGNATPAVPLTESIRFLENGENKAVDRNKYSIIQTPQCFHSSDLKQAFMQEYQSTFTDDASVLESIGKKINLIAGNKENIKVTSPQDLMLAELILSQEK